MSDRPSRELTREERREIKKLVVKECANYDRKYGCLPLDYGRCYMLDKWWTGADCRYFKAAVLPLNPVLEASLLGMDISQNEKTCPVCGNSYIPVTSQAYCSDACAAKGRLESYRKYNKKSKKKQRESTTT